MQYCQTEVIENKPIAHNIFKLTIRRNDSSLWFPGNFTMLLPEPVPQFFSWRRAFSIFHLTDDNLEFVIKKVGKVTELLQQVIPGSKISYIGPLGNSFSIPQESAESIYIVAGGIGIVPLYFLSEIFHKHSLPYTFLYGAATSKEIIEIPELRSHASQIMYATEDGSLGFKGKITELLASLLEHDKKEKRIYACGPFPMLKAFSLNYSNRIMNIEISVETLMACGFGVCRGCAIPVKGNSYKMACVDGPVFILNEIEWEKWQ